MGEEVIKFPAYRRYLNGRSYFKIINAVEFEEVQALGTQRIVRHIVARQYPEKIFISDLLKDYASMASPVTEEEYERFKNGS